MNRLNFSASIPRLAPLAAALILGGSVSSAFATNGYFSHGYGMKAKGMGGASVAMTDNAFAGANNPAIAAWAGSRMELGVDVFMPERGMTRTGSTAGANASVTSDSSSFLVPEFGYNRAISDKLGVGLTVYGNGGMNTDYAGGQTNCTAFGATATSNPLCGSGRLGIDLMQLIVAPTIAYKLSDTQSVGVSPLLVQQIFKADGLSMFSSMSSASGSLTGNGYDSSNGFGVRLGYLGKVSDKVSIGASYSPKIAMSKLSKYAGLFADGGNFDIPENYTVGASFKASPDVTVAVDYEHIGYGSVPSIANSSSNSGQLGTANGKGFGWSDVDAWKIGVQWQATSALTMRAGINVGSNPVKSKDVTFNILAPGVVTTHYTAGGTYALSPSSELTVSYMYAPANSVSGASFFDSMGGAGVGGTETVKMSQQAIGIQFGWKF
jgi:long-chain fatty acid transport protein